MSSGVRNSGTSCYRAGLEAVDPISPKLSGQVPRKPQVMQMRQRLSQGKSDLVCVHFTFEQDLQHIIGGQARRWACGHDVGQPFSMVLFELDDALMQTREGFAMRGQDQTICGKVGEFVQ